VARGADQDSSAVSETGDVGGTGDMSGVRISRREWRCHYLCVNTGSLNGVNRWRVRFVVEEGL
jgi:hypothetical protein